MIGALGRAPGTRAAWVASLASVVLLGGGCALWSPASKSDLEHIWLRLTVRVPQGWMVATFSEGLFVTKHGVELDAIHVRRWPRTAQVKGTGRSIEDGMMAQEIAEISLDSRRLDDGVGGLEVLGNAPVAVGGRDCYRIDYGFRDANGLPRRTVEYGCAVSSWMYRFEFRAAEQHYFAAGLPDFEQLVASAEFWSP